ncbi:MAG: protein phosphatase 2C domain-containing protein, partial [Candidatus Cloacimonadota bacterium]|nr:protein phosphatase 2C domain-containing protein [Candidatus Cloacimonadota bacterium]
MSKIRYAVLSKQGTYHSINQDYLITPQNIVYDLLKNKGYLFAICDGVGGYEGGEIASNFCCNKLLHDYYNETSIGDIKKWFQNKLHEINKQIILKGNQQNLHRMSTTLTALLIKDELFYTFNIGDSRIYKYEDSTLTQLTDDHSLVWEQYQKNLIDKDDIVNSSIKNLITQAMGFELNIDIQIQKHTLPEKFCLLLCS